MKRNLGTAEYELPFSDESDGTRKLTAALPVILLTLREGRMVIIDELDAMLHVQLPLAAEWCIFILKRIFVPILELFVVPKNGITLTK